MAERTYLSIGDVLSLLKDEFPDITISKIRFLESQGLLDPERTPSGYRKFYEEDVDRLRWILRQQRENFLPLKVIKGRLGGNGGGSGGPSSHPEDPDPESTASAAAGVGVARTVTGSRSAVGGSSVGADLRPRGAGTPGPPQGPAGRATDAGDGAPLHQGVDQQLAHGPERGPISGQDDRAATAAGRARAEGEPMARSSTPSAAPASTARSDVRVPSQPRVGRPGTTEASPADTRAPGGPAGRSARPAAGPGGRPGDTAGPGGRPEDTAGPGGRPEDTAGPGGRPEDTAGAGGRLGESAARRSGSADETAEDETGGPLSIGLSGVNLTGEELAGASGLSEDELGELARYGLLVGRAVGDTTYYDEEALTIARLAAGFRRFGIEARHLRMYRTAADREASFFEQIVMPLLKQRNPVARRRAVDTLAELARLGQGLRGSLLRSALKDNTGG